MLHFFRTWIMIYRLQALIILWYLMCPQRTQATTTTNSLVSSLFHTRVHMSSHGHPTVLRAVVNNVVLDSSYCNAAGAQYHRSITGTVVANINQSDAVFIRTHPTGINQGEVVSSDNHRTTFAGWLLF